MNYTNFIIYNALIYKELYLSSMKVFSDCYDLISKIIMGQRHGSGTLSFSEKNLAEIGLNSILWSSSVLNGPEWKSVI